MMNLRFKLGHVLVLCLVLSMALGESIRGAEPDTHIDRLARAYRAARTDSERRAVCLEAIDAGVIARGRSVAVVDAVFGTTYARKLPPSHELDWGVVHFRPSPPSPSDKVAAAYVGWYLAFQLDSAGTLQNYYLSNVHK
jgi:hypothetical protein